MSTLPCAGMERCEQISRRPFTVQNWEASMTMTKFRQEKVGWRWVVKWLAEETENEDRFRHLTQDIYIELYVARRAAESAERPAHAGRWEIGRGFHPAHIFQNLCVSQNVSNRKVAGKSPIRVFPVLQPRSRQRIHHLEPGSACGFCLRNGSFS